MDSERDRARRRRRRKGYSKLTQEEGRRKVNGAFTNEAPKDDSKLMP